jgi:hypothetical protein
VLSVGIPPSRRGWQVVGRTSSPPKGVPISKHVEVLERTKGDPKPRLTVLPRTSCNIPDRSTDCYSYQKIHCQTHKKTAAVTLLNQIEPNSYPGTLNLYDHFNNIIISLPVYLKWCLPFCF